MENNKFSLSVGDIVMLDMEYEEYKKEVEIVYMTEHCLFSDVIELGKTEKYQVITARLTPRRVTVHYETI